MFQPSKGRILVLPDKPAETTSFGLIIVQKEEAPVTGTVVVGNKDVKEGERILFSRFGLDEFEMDGKNYVVVSDSGVLGKYE